jgi:hypothetical protein
MIDFKPNISKYTKNKVESNNEDKSGDKGTPSTSPSNSSKNSERGTLSTSKQFLPETGANEKMKLRNIGISLISLTVMAITSRFWLKKEKNNR